MPYQLSWLVEGRVIQVMFSGETTVLELQEFVRAIKGYLDQGEKVHIISDVSLVEKFPMNLGLLNMLTSDMIRHPHLDWGVTVTPNSLTRHVAAMVMEIGRIRFRVFATRREGLAFLNKADTTLPDLLAFSQHNNQ